MMSNLNWKFWQKRSVTISEYDPSYRVVYLGNVLTPWAKGGAIEKPLATLWKNYCSNVKRDIHMKITICSSGIKAVTKEHGLTEYWANRITYCATHPSYPRVFCWVYRHEGRKMKQELRCHAVLCPKDDKPRLMENQLTDRLHSALQEFRREKRSRQRSRQHGSLPRRRILLSTGAANFRAPLERSKSAPKLSSIVEDDEEEYEEGVEDDDYLTEETSSSLMMINDLQDIDQLSDHFLNSCTVETDSIDSLTVEDSPNGGVNRSLAKKPLKAIDEVDADNISDESGYSEEKDLLDERIVVPSI